MKITVLTEDKKPLDRRLKNEHGVSLFCESMGHTFLFDLGETGIAMENAKILGLDIASVEFAVISHAHDDHGGGLTYFLAENQTAPIILSARALGDYYVKHGRSYHPASLDAALLKENQGRLQLIGEDTEILPGFHIIINIKNEYPAPAFCARMAEKKEGVYVPDHLEHEIFLAVEEEDGVKVLTGCSHHGIRNIYAAALKKFPSVAGLAGGFHLYGSGYAGPAFFGEPADNIKNIGRELANVPRVYTGHCTGDRAYRMLKRLCNAKYLTTGETFIL
jgi:7,8-dihydropterin-6-yl-methyl-4-(beta-D-ribofuranosyl)aminobenzene 5'-phosphate synthase